MCGVSSILFRYRLLMSHFHVSAADPRISIKTPIRRLLRCILFKRRMHDVTYSTVSVMFISLTLTNVESRMSRDFFPWILRGISVDFA